MKQKKPLYHEPEATEPIHNLHKIQHDYPETHKEGQLCRAMDSLSGHQVSILPHSNSEEAALFSLLQLESQGLPFQEFFLWPSTAPKTILRVKNPIPPQYWRIYITKFLYIDDALVLANSYTQAKEGWQRVMQLPQRLGLILSLESTSWSLIKSLHTWIWCSTHTILLCHPQDNILEIKTQAAKVVSSPTCWGMMRLLGLTNFVNMALSLAWLHSHPYNSGSRRITSFQPTCSRAWCQTQSQPKPCIGAIPWSHNQTHYADL